MKHKGILVVVSGFSGAGKGTLMKRLIQDYDNYALSISATTRAPRPGEEDGREYFFLQKEQFEKKIAENGLIEYARYCDNYYGTPREYVEKQLEAGRYPDALLLFVMPPSAAELRRRLIGRGTETEEVIEKRMHRASEEAEGIENYEYIVINDDLDTCVKELHEIIKTAHNTPLRNEEFIEKIRRDLEGEK